MYVPLRLTIIYWCIKYILLNVGFQAFTDNEECRQLPESAKMSRPPTRQAGAVHHPNSNINLDEVGEGESLESKMVLPDDFDDVIKDMVSQ